MNNGSLKSLRKARNINFMQVTTLDEGRSFGELAILTNKPRAARVIAEESTYCAVLLKSDFFKVINQIDN